MAIKSSDQISIVDLTDGFSVNMTNDSYCFPGTETAAIGGSTTTAAYATCGSQAVKAKITNADIIKPTGISTSVDSTDEYQPVVTISIASTVTESGTVKIPVYIPSGDVTIMKYFTYSISFRGTKGDTGSAAQWYTGTKITGNSTTPTKFSDSGITDAKVGEMYLNTATQNTYRCVTKGNAATAEWIYVSNLKGISGDSAQWYTGTEITGVNTTPTVFSKSGIANAIVGDMYINTQTQNTYRCTTPGNASTAKWAYVTNIKGGKGDDGADAITMSITSSNGSIFKNTAIDTILRAHVYQAGVELSETQIDALGTIKWYKDGSSTALSTGFTLEINAGDVTNKASYIAQLEG